MWPCCVTDKANSNLLSLCCLYAVDQVLYGHLGCKLHSLTPITLIEHTSVSNHFLFRCSNDWSVSACAVHNVCVLCFVVHKRRWLSLAIWLLFMYLFWRLGDPFPMLSPRHGKWVGQSCYRYFRSFYYTSISVYKLLFSFRNGNIKMQALFCYNSKGWLRANTLITTSPLCQLITMCVLYSFCCKLSQFVTDSLFNLHMLTNASIEQSFLHI